MKLKLHFILSAFLVISFTTAQTQLKYNWAKGLSGTNNLPRVNDLAVDANGNTYIVGSVSGNVDFDPSTSGTAMLGSNDDGNIFIAKYDADGKYVWAYSMGSYLPDAANAIDVDASGNIYVVGSFIVDAYFGPGPNSKWLSGGGGVYPDFFFAKYDSNGNLVFAHSLANNAVDHGVGVRVGKDNNVYITGSFGGYNYDFDFSSTGSTSITSAGWDTFLASYKTNGDFNWVKKIGGAGDQYPTELVLDANDNIYLTGNFTGTAANFDPTGTASTIASKGLKDAFIAKYDSQGNYQWALGIGGTGNDNGFDVTIDKSGNVFAVGEFVGAVDFDPSLNTAMLSPSGTINPCGYIAKYNSNGGYINAFHYGDGWYNGKGSFVNSIDIDDQENIYATGGLSETFDFNPSGSVFNLTWKGGASDIFVSRYTSNLTFIDAYAIGSSGTDFGAALKIVNNKYLHLAGSFTGVVDFDTSTDTANQTANSPAMDLFLAKYCIEANCNALLGVEDLIKNDVEFSVYPNPSNGIYHFTSNQDIDKIIITDVSGKTILTIKDALNYIDISKCSNGIYFYEVISISGSVSKGKLIKNF